MTNNAAKLQDHLTNGCPLRIAHVSATFPPYYGGTGTVCYHNARILAARGYEVHIFTADWPGERDDPLGVRVHRLRPLMRIGNAPILPTLIKQLRNFDLIHLHYPFYFGAEFVALAQRPYVVTYHQDVKLAGRLSAVTTLHHRLIGRFLLCRAARVCPTSFDYFRHSAIADLEDKLADRIIPIPNGVDPYQFHPGQTDVAVRRRYGVPEDGFVALFVGAMDRAHFFKGVPVLLEALAGLPGISMLLVGDGDLRPSYEERAKRLGVDDRAVFTGRIESSELPRLYRATDVAVLPSQTRGEAFGMVLLEAMASGKVVIASDLPGVRSVVAHEETGLLVAPGSVDDLRRALLQIADMSAGNRSQMGAAGRQKVEEQYNWDCIGDQLEALYQSVINEVGIDRGEILAHGTNRNHD